MPLLNVLLHEKHRDASRLIRSNLGAMGLKCRLTVAENQQDILQYLFLDPEEKLLRQIPDLVFLDVADWQTAESDQLMKIVTHEPRLANLPVFLYCSDAGAAGCRTLGQPGSFQAIFLDSMDLVTFCLTVTARLFGGNAN